MMTLKFREVQWLNQGHIVKGRVGFNAVSSNFMSSILSMWILPLSLMDQINSAFKKLEP